MPPPPEVVRPLPAGRRFRLAVFDFDGTLSLVRSGWQRVMAGVMAESLPGETAAERDALAYDLIERTTGHPPLRQFAEFAGLVRARGAMPEPPEAYNALYQARLARHIADRRERLRRGDIPAESLLVPGALGMLRALRERNIRLALLSGTAAADVLLEAELLGLTPYFAEAVFAPSPDDSTFTKRKAMAALLTAHRLDGSDLLAFGDGVVEIEAAVNLGGVAVGITLDEVKGRGSDPRKRERLIAAGASVLAEDLRDADGLLTLFFPGKGQTPR